MITYKIETRPADSNDSADWTADDIGDQNEFDSRDQAEQAIADLRKLGDDWSSAQYRVVENATTDAQRISALYNDDGQCFSNSDGYDDIELEWSLGQAGGRAWPQRHAVRHELPDGSAIIVTDGYWGLGIPSTDDDDRKGCTCFAGAQ